MSLAVRKMLFAGFGNIRDNLGSLVGIKLTASDGAAGDYFGRSVSISADGTTALIGAYYDNNVQTDSGSAYVFKYNGTSWVQQAKLIASDEGGGNYFGYAVSISPDGTTALIGAYYDDDAGSNSGSAYIFKYNGTSWVQQAKLVASDGVANSRFGSAVSISYNGTTALVGAPNYDTGSAYIFKYDGTTWVQQTKLTASDKAASDYLGFSVSISADGSTALIGAPYDNNVGSDSGSAYVFKYNGTIWVEQAKLIASDVMANDRLGYAVSISSDGNTALVGAHYDDNAETDSGSAYVFKYNGTSWVQQAKLTASDGVAGDFFGFAVSTSADGTTALIGAYTEDNVGTDSGSAYVFKYNGTSWEQHYKLTASDGAASDYFGFAVSISPNGTTALIGAYNDDDKGSNSGSVHIFAV